MENEEKKQNPKMVTLKDGKQVPLETLKLNILYEALKELHEKDGEKEKKEQQD